MSETIEQRIVDNKEQIIEELRRVPIIQLACKKASISRATFYRWRKKDENFRDKAQEALDLGVDTVNDLAESKLIENIKKGMMQAIVYWLQHNHKRFKDKFTFEEQHQLELERATQCRREMYGFYKDNVTYSQGVKMYRQLEKEWEKKEKEYQETIRRLTPQRKP